MQKVYKNKMVRSSQTVKKTASASGGQATRAATASGKQATREK